jgi:cellulase/cellobiase CelA1
MMTTTHPFTGGKAQMNVRAAGQNGNGRPNMTTAPVGSSEVRIYFTNDYYQRPVDRNLLIDKATLLCNGEGTVPGSLVAAVLVHDDWGTGYCAHLDITNNGAVPTTDWTVVIDSFDSNVNQYWNTPAISGTGTHTVKWTYDWNRVIAPGSTYSQTGFCALRVAGTNTMPSIVSVVGVY